MSKETVSNADDANASHEETSRRAFIASSGRAVMGSVLIGATPFAAPDDWAARVQQAAADGRMRAADCVRSAEQYKRWGRAQMAKIEDGAYEEALGCLQKALERFPDHRAEHFFVLAVAHAQQGQLEKAADYVQRATDAGLPFERFQAGPRALLAPLADTAAFGRLVERYGAQLLHGPLLGAVTDRRARFWVRTWQEVPVRVVLEGPGAQAPVSEEVSTAQEDDYTAVAEVEGLRPDTEYTYRLVIDGERHPRTWSFRTFPPAGEPGAFEVGFGGCAGYTPWHERIWDLVDAYDFPAFLQTGDNVYIDQPQHPGVQRYCYYRRQSRPEFRRLIASTANYAVWDDHDFGDNDGGGGPAPHEPAWKVDVWRTFKNNWNNPAYGGGTQQPGCWFDFSVADVDFFMLDDRYYRTEPEEAAQGGAVPTMLGPAQKAWLFDRLRASEATFKMLVTSVPWAYGTKPGSTDPWQGYRQEREEIFSFLHEHCIEGVILMSGDRHRADIWKIERAGGGYPLYDLENGRLTNIHTHDRLPGALKSYNEKCTFGRLRFDTAKADPEVHYECITIDDEVAHDFTLRRSQLAYG